MVPGYQIEFPSDHAGRQDIYQFGFNEVDLNQTNVHEALGNFPWSREALENLGAQFAPSAELGDFLDEGAEPGESIESPSLRDSIKAEAKRGLTFSDETTNYWLKKALAEMSNDCTTAQKERAKQILVAHQDLFSTTLRKGRDNFIVGVEAAFQVDRSMPKKHVALPKSHNEALRKAEKVLTQYKLDAGLIRKVAPGGLDLSFEHRGEEGWHGATRVRP